MNLSAVRDLSFSFLRFFCSSFKLISSNVIALPIATEIAIIMTTCLNPDSCRPRRENDVIDASSSSTPFWWSYSCLVCGKPPTTTASSSSSKCAHKRCARCKAAVYCSAECQKQDYTNGMHKANCSAIAKLWERKKRLEDSFWEDKKVKSTNPFDDEEIYHEYPTVGEFWHDQPQSAMQKNTVNYAVTLLQLVQLLGSGE